MNNLIRKSAMPIGAIFVAAFFLIVTTLLLISGVTHADNGSTNPKGRLLTIHDRGNERVVLSQAMTIGDALKEANIIIDNKDLVEPALTEKLVASDYQINIYRARPVIIVDGNSRVKIITPYQTAAQITADAVIKLYDEDTTKLDRTEDILSDGAGLQLTINRAKSFIFTQYGKTTTIRTQGLTVADMLTEKGITMSSDDRVVPAVDTIITDGMTVRLWREGKQAITVEEPVGFETEKIKNADREVGYIEVRTAGIKGLRSVSYEITIQDGVEVGRTEIASVTTLQPVKQVEVVGARGEYTTPTENETITWDFLISNGFTKYQTAGIMGNLMQEHGFNTTDTSGGYGIVQWTGGRRSELLQMAYPENIYTQLNFLMHELTTNYSSVKNNIVNSGTIDDSVKIFQDQFERCGVCRESQRVQFAYNIYATFRDR